MKVKCESGHVYHIEDLSVHAEHWELESIQRFRCPDCHAGTVWTKVVDLLTFPSCGNIGEYIAEIQNWKRDFKAKLRSLNYNEWVIAYFLRNPNEGGVAIAHIIKEFVDKEILGID